MKVNFHMERLSVAIKDSKDKNEIIRLTVEELKSTLTQRPGAQAIKFVSPFYVWRVFLRAGKYKKEKKWNLLLHVYANKRLYELDYQIIIED